MTEALALYAVGDLSGAACKYRDIVALYPHDADSWCQLGMIYHQQQQYEDALDALYQGLAIVSSHALCYYTIALVQAELGYSDQAIQAYAQAIAIAPTWLVPYQNLGATLMAAGQIEAAEQIYRQAIALAETETDAQIERGFSTFGTTSCQAYNFYLGLGNVFMAKHQIDEAIAAYQTALELEPDHPDIANNLGIAFAAKNERSQANLYFGHAAYYAGQYDRAVDYYQAFLELQIEPQVGDVDFYMQLASCYKHLDRSHDAVHTYQVGIRLYPTATRLYLSAILDLQEFGQTQAALKVASDALAIAPYDLSLQLENLRILPILYDHQEEVSFYRDRFTQGLDAFLRNLSLDTKTARQNALQALSVHTNFYLQYQGGQDLDLQVKYGQVVHQIMAANFPQWVQPIPPRSLDQQRKIRIGYLSSCFQWHTVGTLFLGWLRYSDRTQFSIHCYYIDSPQDQVNQIFQLYSDTFDHIPNHLEAVCQKIIGDRLDILVFLDVGMHPQMTQLAGLRLAPIQCAAWGHPVTTGSPAIDYFLSSELMEPENAQSHYSEQLVRLPNLGISYPKPIVPHLTKSRADFHLRDDAVIYLSCQSLFKYLPKYDYIFAAIAQQVTQSQFVFVGHWSSAITEKFRDRLQRAFGKFGLDSEAYCVILPRQSKLDYWNLQLLSDIFLDTLGFTGLMTTLDAVACNLPIVTCAGEFMRSRQSAGVLQMLKATETVAMDESTYIQIAIRLGLEQSWREAIAQKMQSHHTYLDDDRACIFGLEEFYRQVIK